MPTQFLYFDLGNVLLSFSYDRMIRQISEVSKVSPNLIRNMLQPGAEKSVYAALETGDLSADENYELFCAGTGTRPDRAALELAANDMFEPIPEMLSLIERLAAAGNRLGLLSNTNPCHWSFTTDGRYPCLHSPGSDGSPFELAVTSYEARSMKPDSGIYTKAIERAGLPPSEIFFTDDRQDNIEGALAAGIDAVLFTGYALLVAELQRRNVPGV